MSFTEFSYQIMQAYDFFYLNQRENCTVQIGGSDQWGNITEGCDLISKLTHKTAYGITLPLLTTSTGEKLGKSVGIGGAVWLSPHRTTPYDFYQYWVRMEDADVEKYLKLFTFLPLEEITQVIAQHKKAPEQRRAQRILAEHVTTFVHGAEATHKAQHASKLLFGQSGEPMFEAMKYEDLVQSGFTKNAPIVKLNKEQVIGQSVISVALTSKVAASKSMSMLYVTTNK
jgi:tyrosyl-tRNA synthetase